MSRQLEFFVSGYHVFAFSFSWFHLLRLPLDAGSGAGGASVYMGLWFSDDNSDVARVCRGATSEAVALMFQVLSYSHWSPVL